MRLQLNCLSKLITRGLSEQDIINIAAAIEKYAAGGANTSSPAGRSSTDKQPQLISDLEKYGGLKSTIERLTQQENTLTRDLEFLIKSKS